MNKDAVWCHTRTIKNEHTKAYCIIVVKTGSGAPKNEVKKLDQMFCIIYVNIIKLSHYVHIMQKVRSGRILGLHGTYIPRWTRKSHGRKQDFQSFLLS